MKKWSFILWGLLLILLYNVPYFINGENSYFRIHDYLEQDFVYVHLNAKYLLHPFVNNIPELFNGTYRASIQGHSFLQILLYKFIVQGYLFVILNQIFMSLVGYIGMYIFLDKIYKINNRNISKLIGITVSFLFSISPVLLHGMTAMSIPLYLYVIWRLNEDLSPKEVLCFTLISFLVGLSTSVLYGDFIFFIIGIISIVYQLYLKHFKRAFNLIINGLALLGAYFITFFYSFMALGEISSRTEMSVFSSFNETFVKYVFNGLEVLYSPTVIIILLMIEGIYLIIRKKYTIKEFRLACLALLIIIGISILSAFYCSDLFGSFVPEKFRLIYTIHFNRAVSFNLFLWNFVFASTLIIGYKILKSFKLKKEKLLIILGIIIIFVMQLFFTINIKGCYYKKNFDLMYKKEHNLITYSRFFSKDIMNEIKLYINRPQSEYRVVSIGINPGAVLYNGFYCLDGYSTNYRLEYKKQFRKVILDELNKGNYKTAGSKTYKEYFNNFGGRVYIVSAELKRFGFDYKHYVEPIKEINHLDIDYDYLRYMGCNYLLSKYKINNASKNLKLEKIFYDKNTPKYQIYLYSFI